MKAKTRIFYQVVLWLIVWTSQWALQQFSFNFIKNNFSLFICQAIIILSVVYWLTPKFIYKKKYLAYSLISFIGLLILPCINNDFGLTDEAIHPPHPPLHMPPPLSLIHI